MVWSILLSAPVRRFPVSPLIIRISYESSCNRFRTGGPESTMNDDWPSPIWSILLSAPGDQPDFSPATFRTLVRQRSDACSARTNFIPS
jgi:hypothetical protein